MSYFLGCLVLAVSPALGQSGPVPVAIYTHFQQPAPAVVSESIRSEVDNIMAPLDLPLHWQSLEAARGDEMVRQLAVVTFRGVCNTNNLVTPPDLRGGLGFTHLTEGVVIPFTEVDCDGIRGFLRKSLAHTLVKDREATYGRAVGRVLAHELFHIFAGTSHHSSGGVAEPAFTVSELTSGRFQFESGELRLLRASLKQARQEYSRSRPAASPLSGRSIFQEDGCASCHGSSGEGTRLAPALRANGKPLDVKTLAARLSTGFATMSTRARNRRLPAPSLDDDEIADVVSFLNAEF